VSFADHFSRQSREYTQFRPRYPRELFELLASLAPRRETAWDCGTGNGQAAVDLAEQFQRVIATDPSANQVAHARAHPKVEYFIARAEECPIKPRSVDLVCVAQALHWFDRPRFYEQVRRVGREGSVLAAWGYGMAHVTPAVDRVIGYLYEDILGKYWPPERKLVEARYETIEFPFEPLEAPRLMMTAEWTLDDVLGYMGTWSSVQRFVERHGADPLAQPRVELAQAWGEAQQRRLVRWPLYLRIGRIE
jgi:SAM-dependent methyltransferase